MKYQCFIIFLCFIINNCKTKEISNNSIVIANALLHTTFDSVSLIFPKEMGYKKDLRQLIYKIKTNNYNRHL